MKITVLEPLGMASDKLKTILDPIKQDNEIIYYDSVPEDKREIIQRCKDSEVLILAQVKIDREVIDNCPKLKYINIAFTGVDHVDVAYAKEKGIAVSNASGYSTNAVAELVFGLIIALYRKIILADKATRSSLDKKELLPLSELAGKTIGIIGAGKIGKKVAQIALAFECNVLIYSNHNPNIEGTEFVSLEELLKRSDIITLHVPANSSTKDLISKKEFNLMKSSAILVNTARGSVVDTQALIDALNNHKIQAAGLDVYNCEPPLSCECPLLGLDNVILTPHIGFVSSESFQKRALIIRDNLAGYLNSNLQNLV